MAKTLDEFVDEIEKEIDGFVAEYKAKSDSEGVENYPMEFEDGNEDIWIEFFTWYLTSGKV